MSSKIGIWCQQCSKKKAEFVRSVDFWCPPFLCVDCKHLGFIYVGATRFVKEDNKKKAAS